MVAPTVWARIRAELDRSGWRQYAEDEFFQIPDEEWDSGPCCLLQAIGRVPIDNEQWPAMQNRIHSHTGGTGIGDWNDHPGRTLADVYALLDTLDAEDRAAA